MKKLVSVLLLGMVVFAFCSCKTNTQIDSTPGIISEQTVVTTTTETTEAKPTYNIIGKWVSAYNEIIFNNDGTGTCNDLKFTYLVEPTDHIITMNFEDDTTWFREYEVKEGKLYFYDSFAGVEEFTQPTKSTADSSEA